MRGIEGVPWPGLCAGAKSNSTSASSSSLSFPSSEMRDMSPTESEALWAEAVGSFVTEDVEAALRECLARGDSLRWRR